MGLVDYDRVAARYDEGRSPLAQAEVCRAAVEPHLPRRSDGRLRVLDLGAGTGIFAREWPGWSATQVLAVDPALPMLGEARRVGLPPEVHAVNGRGEAIPLRDGVADVAWVSTVFHHFTDKAAAAAELHRTIVPGGILFLRSGYSDVSPLPEWCAILPGADLAYMSLAKLADQRRILEAHGFVFQTVEALPQPFRPAGEVREWVGKMRHADSLLGRLTDEEYATGLAALEALADDRPIDCGFLHIAVFERP